MKRQCHIIRELEKAEKIEEMYKTTGYLTKRDKIRISEKGMIDKNGKVTTDEEEIKVLWKEYIEELYCTHDFNGRIDLEDEDSKGPRILRDEVKRAIKDLRDKKTVGSDGIPAEVLKALGESAIGRLTDLINKIYDTGEWPDDFLKTIMMPLPKKRCQVRT
ncbi:hypothetical protein J437_LFUL015971 [Ladona fulva]|uniref:Reverse transcriptase n=1 Tax=Ladona fulva TaxID=123851 RepID=A0A8K0KJJ0_LADFU|nr:hypothetical protein J437_LFUL015971 [Ladona fulva]